MTTVSQHWKASVCSTGYGLADGYWRKKIGKQEVKLFDGFIVENTENDMTMTYLPIDPAEHTGLFHNFARLEMSHEAVLRFANRYGFLGTELRQIIAEKNPTFNLKGEAFRDWVFQHKMLQHAVFFYEHIKAEDNKTLRGCFGISKGIGENAFFECKFSFQNQHKDSAGHPVIIDVDKSDYVNPVIASKAESPELFRKLQKGDFVLAANLMLSKLINANVKSRIITKMISIDSKMQIVQEVDSLLGAIWFQFAKAIDEDKQYRQCMECTEYYEISPEVGRTSKLYCSDACRMKAYRKRKSSVGA